MTKNLCLGDVALIDILETGATDAPKAILEEQKHKGHLKFTRGRPLLTVKGHRRAKRLRDMHEQLKVMFGPPSGGLCAMRAVPEQRVRAVRGI